MWDGMMQGKVAPCVGAWIETLISISSVFPHESLPAWERGLKQVLFYFVYSFRYVAPCVGAWIETMYYDILLVLLRVSLPAWERGLKLRLIKTLCQCMTVAPCVGAWIETYRGKLACQI